MLLFVNKSRPSRKYEDVETLKIYQAWDMELESIKTIFGGKINQPTPTFIGDQSIYNRLSLIIQSESNLSIKKSCHSSYMALKLIHFLEKMSQN